MKKLTFSFLLFVYWNQLWSGEVEFAFESAWGTGEYSDLATHDGWVYGCNSSGMEIWRLTASGTLTKITRTAQGGSLMALSDEVVFLWDGTLTSLDVSDPNHPKLLDQLVLSGHFRDMLVFGHHLFLAGWSAGIYIIDIEDPTHLVLVGTHMDGLEPRSLAVSGEFLIAGGWEDHVHSGHGDYKVNIYDVEEQNAKLEFLASFEVDFWKDFVTHDQCLYLGTNEELQIWSLSDPEHPALLGRTDSTYAAIVVDGTLAFVVDSDQLEIFDVSDPTAPVSAGSLSLDDRIFRPNNMTLDSGSLVMSMPDGGLLSVNVQDLDQLAVAFRSRDAGFAYDIVLRDHLAFLAHGRIGLRILDISDVAQPELVVTLGTNWGFPTKAVAVSGNTVFYGPGYLAAWDVSDLHSPTFLSGLPLDKRLVQGDIEAIVLYEDKAFVATAKSLFLVDVGDPTQMHVLDTWDFRLTVWSYSDIFIDQSFCYFASEYLGLTVFDMAYPSELRAVGWLDLPRPVGVFGYGQELIVADEETGLALIEVDKKHRPTVADTYFSGNGANSVFSVGHQVYLAEDRGLRILSREQHGNFRSLGYEDGFGPAWDVAVQDQHVFFTNGIGGQLVILTPQPERETNVVPWVVNNPQFCSQVVWLNQNAVPATVDLEAVTHDGQSAKGQIIVPANGTFFAQSRVLFPNLTGYSLFSTSPKKVETTFLTRLSRDSECGAGVSQTRGTHVDQLTSAILFSGVPGTEPVGIVMVAPQPTELRTQVELSLYSGSDDAVYTAQVTLNGRQPRADMLQNLFPNVAFSPYSTLKAVAQNGTHLTGVSFVFDAQHEPSMVSAIPVRD